MSKNQDQTDNYSWSYSPAPESTSSVQLKKEYELFINGEFVKAKSKSQLEAVNPSSGEVLARISKAGLKDVEEAIKAAKEAYFKTWGKLSGKERGKYIFRIARMIQERARELAVVESLDSGKPIRESRDFDIPAAAAHFFYYAGWADKLDYAFPNRSPESLGVVAQIIPWNFPLLMAAWKLAPALATGNTVVLKPAESSSLSALKLAEILRDCELPHGVVNIITGNAETGESLVKHPDVKKIAFTGSTEVGKHIQDLCSDSDKKLSLELGGKAAHIVLDDAPLDQAVEGVVNGIFFNQGHVCCAGSRLLLQENIQEEFLKKLKFRMEKLIVGDPLDKNTDIGAIHKKEQLEKINRYIEMGRKENLEIFQCKGSLPGKGFYCKPTLILNASQSSKVVQEEIFGPVLSVQSFRTVEEAIDKANNTRYGLSAGIWSSKGARIFNVSAKLKAGVIWANSYNKFDPASPFGGYKESGYGREGGLMGLYSYLELE